MEYDYSEDLKKMISDNIAAVRESIDDAVKVSGREKGSVTLIGVTKVFPVEYAEAAAVSGLTDLGENRVQELVPKVERFSSLGLDVNWHLIGTLQKNKVKYIIGKTALIHSVNTVELAEEISKRSESNNVTSRLLLQANVSGEESKHGFAPHELKPAIDKIMALPSIELCGLMTMAPIEEYEGQAREVFAKTRVIYEDLKSYTGLDSWNVLSMGMSQDYKSAVYEGSTHIRIGTAIFGNRALYKPV
ncbi:MAG: YggS family pyridoxal phosphate-dependent enzyme [Clostridiales bacterium]|nr:YggS family pyridoxal phosphate-dependent enzyme [Clostridiales bacterium]